MTDNDRKLIDFWDKESKKPGFTSVVGGDQTLSTKMVYDFFSANFDFTDKLILEIGCGVGRLARFFSTIETKGYIGLDHSMGMVLRSKEAVLELAFQKEAKLLQAKAPGLPFRDLQFDVVILWTVLMHIMDDDEFYQSILEAKRVSKAGVLICDTLSVAEEFRCWDDKAKIRTYQRYKEALANDKEFQLLYSGERYFGSIDHPDSLRGVFYIRRKGALLAPHGG